MPLFLQALIPLAGPSVSTSEEAEVLACRKALEFAVHAGFRDVVEGDNSAVMRLFFLNELAGPDSVTFMRTLAVLLRGFGV